MQVAAAVRREDDLHHILSFRLGAGHLIENLPVERVPIAFENIERKGHIAGGELGAIMKTRLGAQQKAIGQLVVGHAHSARQQAIKRVRFVRRAGHQRVKAHVHARSAVTFQHINIECVEGFEVLVAIGGGQLQHKAAAFGRVRIHIGKMFEIRRLRQFAKGRKAMRFPLRRAGEGGQGHQSQAGGRKFEQGASVESKHVKSLCAE